MTRHPNAAVENLRRGGFALVVDDEDPEREGNLLVAASHATPAAINFMARHARGVVCLPMAPAQCDRLLLSQMAPPDLRHPDVPAFTVSIEARAGVTTGISAFDRSRTIQAAVNVNATPEDVVTPGHIFPIRARAGGVLDYPGKAEAAVDLVQLACLPPAAVICGVMSDDGRMATIAELTAFCARHDLPMVRVREIVSVRRAEEAATRDVAQRPRSGRAMENALSV